MHTESFKAFEIEKNQFSLSILQLLKVLIQFGFYTQIQEFHELLLILIKILQSTKDITYLDEQKLIFNDDKKTH